MSDITKIDDLDYVILGKIMALTSVDIDSFEVSNLHDRIEALSVDSQGDINKALDLVLGLIHSEDALSTAIKKPIPVYPGRPTPTPYAVICNGPWDMDEEEGCGIVYLTEAEYNQQIMNIDSQWKCPICKCGCWPHDGIMCGDYPKDDLASDGPECRACGNAMDFAGDSWVCQECGETTEIVEQYKGAGHG